MPLMQVPTLSHLKHHLSDNNIIDSTTPLSTPLFSISHSNSELRPRKYPTSRERRSSTLANPFDSQPHVRHTQMHVVEPQPSPSSLQQVSVKPSRIPATERVRASPRP